MMNPIDAIYARQSIDKADSISVESQIERCIYETHGQPYKTYCDKGYSGKDTLRPAFQSLMSDIKKGQIKRVICYKLDRCSRSILDFTHLMQIFDRYGVEFVSCTEKFDTSTPMGRAMLSICVVFAQLERETIQQRIYDAYHARSKRGFYMGGKVPFGFSLQEHSIDGKRTSRYCAVAQEKTLIEKMYAIYEKAGASLSDIVKTFQSLGIKNPRRDDGLWISSHIGRMLKNPIYVKTDLSVYRYFCNNDAVLYNCAEEFMCGNGAYLYRKDGQNHLVLAPHEGIVDADVWLACQEKFMHYKARDKTQKSKNSWLCGKLKCAYCGYACVIRKRNARNGKSYRYFICSHRSLSSCKQHSVNAQVIESIVGNAIIEQISRFENNNEKTKVLKHLNRFDSLSQEVKERIAEILIRKIDLSEQKITITWHI